MTCTEGIVLESGSTHHFGGIAALDSIESRTLAAAVVRLGYHYWTIYRDAQGPGLSWAWDFSNQVRPSAADRLPSVRRERKRQAAYERFQRS